MDIPLVSVLYWKPNSFFALWSIKFRRRDCVQLQPLCLTIEIQWLAHNRRKGSVLYFKIFTSEPVLQKSLYIRRDDLTTVLHHWINEGSLSSFLFVFQCLAPPSSYKLALFLSPSPAPPMRGTRPATREATGNIRGNIYHAVSNICLSFLLFDYGFFMMFSKAQICCDNKGCLF